LAGPSRRNGYTGRRGTGVLSAREFAMGSDGEASADLRTITRATLRCLLSGEGNTVTESGWGKRRGIWKARYANNKSNSIC
jgi:hypothetical protein